MLAPTTRASPHAGFGEGDRTFKLASGTTLGYGRYVKFLSGARDRASPVTSLPQVCFLVRMTYSNEAIRTCMYPCIDGVTH